MNKPSNGLFDPGGPLPEEGIVIGWRGIPKSSSLQALGWSNCGWSAKGRASCNGPKISIMFEIW